jgi:hypothetical protein
VANPGIFKTYKQRGEWVELLFMARAAEHGLCVSRPFGDSTGYDVSVESEGRFWRVQVKSTSAARGDKGFICTLKRTGIHYYRIDEVDFFAIHVVPEDVWYILPARVVLWLNSNIRLAPSEKKQKYRRYIEAWKRFRRKRRVRK